MHRVILGLLAGLWLGLPVFTTEEWTRWGGPNQTLQVAAEADFESAASVSWNLAWRQPFGSGYSAVLALNDRLISAAATDGGDAVFALNPANGEVLWQTVIAPVWVARNGSDDGPFSTPTVARDHVYMMHPSGVLVCLALSDGRPKWRRDLVKEFGGVHPLYGFSAVPVVTGDLVIAVAGGTAARTVVGFDWATGETRWVSGVEDECGYQNPVLTRFEGTQQLLVATNRHLLGMHPGTGKILWQHALGFEDDMSILVPLNETDFILKGRFQTIRYSLQEDGKNLKERWRQNVLTRNHCQPIASGGYLYGFSGQFLSCVNAVDGQVVWKSRPPGGDVVAMVDDVLLIPDRQGALTAVRATPAGYRPLGTIAMGALRRNYTPPVYYKGRVYIRDLHHLYAFELVPNQNELGTGKSRTDSPGQSAKLNTINQFLRDLPQHSDPQRAISRFLDRYPAMPAISEDGYAHFFFHGKRDDLAIIGDMTGKFFPEPMHRVGRTDLFHRAFPIEPGTRWEYKFREFSENLLDPLNPHKFSSENGEWNLLIHGPWQEPAWRRNSTQAKPAELQEFKVTNPRGGEDYAYAVYLPPSYGQKSREKFPLVVFTHGQSAIEHGKLLSMFTELQGKTFGEAVVVFCKFPNSAWWGINQAHVQDMVSNHILPKLETDFRIQSDPIKRVLITQGFHTQNAAYLAWDRPGGFGNLIVQSPMINPGLIDRNLAELAAKQNGAKAVVDWSAFDGYNPAWYVDARRAGPQLVKVWGDNGIHVIENNRQDGYGWVGWRKEMPGLLAKVLPAQ